jgi:hypothetical protein
MSMGSGREEGTVAGGSSCALSPHAETASTFEANRGRAGARCHAEKVRLQREKGTRYAGQPARDAGCGELAACVIWVGTRKALGGREVSNIAMAITKQVHSYLPLRGCRYESKRASTVT